MVEETDAGSTTATDSDPTGLHASSLGATGDGSTSDDSSGVDSVGETGHSSGTSAGTSTTSSVDTDSLTSGFVPDAGSSVPPIGGTGGDYECAQATPKSCDILLGGVMTALGLGCPDGVAPTSFAVTAAPQAVAVHEGALGATGEYAAVEGKRFVILSTGEAHQLTLSREEIELASGCPADADGCPSTEHPPEHTLAQLPAPIIAAPVDPELTCKDDPKLIGTGDCSNTILNAWQAGNGELLAHDYVDIRFTATVPAEVSHLRFRWAFLTAEYPARVDTGFNDLFLVWIESERWTGNVAYDGEGLPVSVDATRFDLYDAPLAGSCTEGCVAPELHGTGMEGHAATEWIDQSVPVNVGDEITVVFALFDVGDAAGDSAILLDGVQWDCPIPG
ncbi:MAG: choice-of-anchor L domain-containing protein [Nannocystaceae bacterium]